MTRHQHPWVCFSMLRPDERFRFAHPLTGEPYGSVYRKGKGGWYYHDHTGHAYRTGKHTRVALIRKEAPSNDAAAGY